VIFRESSSTQIPILPLRCGFAKNVLFPEAGSLQFRADHRPETT